MNSLSSHVLDTTLGRPAANMKLRLTFPSGEQVEGVTDSDGRCKAWGDRIIESGFYTLRFDTGEYLLRIHNSNFYPYVDVHFNVSATGGHYHIPLLISPYGYSSYRGS